MGGSVFAPFYIDAVQKVISAKEDSAAHIFGMALATGPAQLSSKQVVGREAVGRSPVVWICPCNRVEISVHPVIESPIQI